MHPSFSRRVDAALQALLSASDLLSLLDSLDEAYTQVEKRFLEIAKGAHFEANAASAHSLIHSIQGIISKTNARKLFLEIEELKFRLSSALADGFEGSHIVEPIGAISEFADAYNDYLILQVGINALPLLQVSRRLRQILYNFGDFFRYLSANSSGILVREANEAEFSMVLLNVSSLRDFAQKLSALNKLYEELCFILDVTASSNQLRVGKIESGSLWTRLFGDTRAIGLMLQFVESAVRYFHRNFTTEGKIAAIPKKIEALDSILQFSNRLKDSGVNVTAINENLAKNAAVIAENLNELLSNQQTVELNGQTISINSEIEKHILKNGLTPMLSYQEPKPGENQSAISREDQAPD